MAFGKKKTAAEKAAADKAAAEGKTEETMADAGKEADAAVAAKDGEEAPEAEPKVKLPKYKVAAKWYGSIGGSITTMAKGKIIDPHGYGGEPGIEMLKKSGLQLEKV